MPCLVPIISRWRFLREEPPDDWDWEDLEEEDWYEDPWEYDWDYYECTG